MCVVTLPMLASNVFMVIRLINNINNYFYANEINGQQIQTLIIEGNTLKKIARMIFPSIDANQLMKQ